MIVTDAPDVTTMRLVGRLRDEGVALVADTCESARRPLVLDLSELTSASEAAVLLLNRLAAGGVHILGASQYVRLLLERAESAPPSMPSPKQTGPRGRSSARPKP